MMDVVRAIVHVYRRNDNVFIVPLVLLADGPWQETLPIGHIKLDHIEELAIALSEARDVAGQVIKDAPNAWFSSLGSELKEADSLCAVRWYEASNIRLVPQEMRITDDIDGRERGWYDIRNRSIEFSAAATLQTLARAVLEEISTEESLLAD